MTSNSSVRDLSQKAYREFHLDGIIDLLVGLTGISLALWLQLDIAAFAFLSWFSIIFYKSLKKSITIPRFGYVSFEEDKPQTLLFMGGALVLLLALLGARFFLFAPDHPQLALAAFLRKNHPFVMGGLGAVALVVFGAWRGIRRFVGYGLFLLGTIGICYGWECPGQTPLFLAGGVMVAVGLALLIRFLRLNPLLETEVNNAS